MSSWTKAICERCWINRYSGWAKLPEGGEKLPPVNLPHRLIEVEVERCAYCGEPTIFGAYVRDDPATVPFPATALRPEEA